MKAKFSLNCRVARWPRGSVDVHWPYNFGPPPKFHHVDDAGSNPVYPGHSVRLPHGENTYKLNFLQNVVRPGGGRKRDPSMGQLPRVFEGDCCTRGQEDTLTENRQRRRRHSRLNR